MVRNYVLAAVSCLLVLPGIASAIGIEAIGGDPPDPLSLTTSIGTVQATPSEFCGAAATPALPAGDCTFIFENNTGLIVTGLDFNFDIATGLTQAEINDTFTCSQGGAGYFLNCAITYTASTGDLNYQFSGVKPPDGDETCGLPGSPSDCEINEQEGIPLDGIFRIELTGFLADATVGDPISVFPNGLPEISSDFTTTPEPSTLFPLGIGLLLLAGAFQFRRRKALSRS
jgi:PEP-CTERM motif-containing protein